MRTRLRFEMQGPRRFFVIFGLWGPFGPWDLQKRVRDEKLRRMDSGRGLGINFEWISAISKSGRMRTRGWRMIRGESKLTGREDERKGEGKEGRQGRERKKGGVSGDAP